MISFITVNYKGDKWIDLLLKSINNTISHLNYETIVVLNSPSKLDYSKYVNVKVVDNSKTKTVGGEGHAEGLTRGFERVDPKSKVTVILDQDVGLLSKNWDQTIQSLMDNYVLIGGSIETEAYSQPFLRPQFLAFLTAIFRDEILFKDGFKPNLPIGDTTSRLFAFVERSNLPYKVLPNSRNWSKQYESLFKYGETIYLPSLKPLCHHVGRSVHKSHRLGEWKEFLDEY